MNNSKNVSSNHSTALTSGYALMAQVERGLRYKDMVLTPKQSEEIIRRAKKQLSMLQRSELHDWLLGKQGCESLPPRTSRAFCRAVQIVLLDRIAMSEILALYHRN